MKVFVSLLLTALSLPSFAGLIRHDIPDSHYTDFGNATEFHSVGLVAIEKPATSGICSGTVIHKNWVLTAAHCLTDATRMGISIGHSDEWRFYEAASWISHENYNDEQFYLGWDIGLMHFETDLDVAPASLYRGTSEQFNYAFDVGFGLAGDGYTGIKTEDYQRRAGTNIIDFAWSEAGDGAQLLWSDFDHPTDQAYNSFPFDGVTFDDVASFLEIMIAFGDSGGGLFIQEGDQMYLAGVHSFISDYKSDGIFGYGDTYSSTRVSTFANWIDSKINPVAVSESSSLALLVIVGLMLMGVRQSPNK